MAAEPTLEGTPAEFAVTAHAPPALTGKVASSNQKTPLTGNSFIRRALDVRLQLKSQTFNDGDGTSNTLDLTGLRVQASITRGGLFSQDSGDIHIFGMTLAHMNKLSIIGLVPDIITIGNIVTLLATNPDGSMSIAYRGQISLAFASFQSMPEVSLSIQSFGVYDAALLVLPPTSVRGSADVATIMNGLAIASHYQFENHGVTAKIANPYYPGSALQQMQAVAEHADINFAVENNTTLAIWPKGGQRAGTDIPLISPQTGMVGYPSKSNLGVEFTTLYDPRIAIGKNVEVKSQLPQCSGIWNVYDIAHELESETPDGAWFTHVKASLKPTV